MLIAVAADMVRGVGFLIEDIDDIMKTWHWPLLSVIC